LEKLLSKLKLYSFKNCGTCKKAIKYLESYGLNYELVDVTTTPPTVNELKKVLKNMDGNIKKLFNTSGQVYRTEGYSEKIKGMTDDEALFDLSQKGKLVKRPLILNGAKGLCGFKEEMWDELLK
jgi:Spx/MgsR family transcriptional regulator